MNNKKPKSNSKGTLKRVKPKKAGLESPHSERRGCHERASEMETSWAIWDAHDDPC